MLSKGHVLPGVFHPVVERFNAVFRPLGKGSLTADMAEFSSDSTPRSSCEAGEGSMVTPAPRPLREALQRWAVQQPDALDLIPPTVVSYDKRVDISGTTYRPHNIAWGDSFILVGTEVDWNPARIHSIFSVEMPRASGREIITLLSVSRFRPLSLSDAVFDDYRAFPYAGGRIYYCEELPQEVIGQGEVLSHFAYTPNVCERISEEHFHALPLTRVRFLVSVHSFAPVAQQRSPELSFFIFCAVRLHGQRCFTWQRRSLGAIGQSAFPTFVPPLFCFVLRPGDCSITARQAYKNVTIACRSS